MIRQLLSNYRSERQTELADIRTKVVQLRPNLAKTSYKEGLMELRASQDGVVKELATTTIGAVVQPGAVIVAIVPNGELLFADVAVKNEDIGFVRVNQTAQIKLATYPFQRYGMLTGKVVHLSADATDISKQNAAPAGASGSDVSPVMASYRARVQLDRQVLIDAQGNRLALASGMQVIAEISQGKRTVLEYLLSPVQKAITEAARER
ncbi:MAG: HlyD family efflux transporter periplasmic adaptor subunit [Pseudomonadota bacterium]